MIKMIGRVALLGFLFAGAAHSAEIGGSVLTDRSHSWGTVEGGTGGIVSGFAGPGATSAHGYAESGVAGSLAGRFGTDSGVAGVVETYQRGFSATTGDNAFAGHRASGQGSFSANGSFDSFGAGFGAYSR